MSALTLLFSERQGCVGPVGKSAWDLALGLSALTGFKIDYTASLAENQQFRVGIVRGNYWLDDPKDNPSLASEHEKILGDTVSKITQVLDVKVDNLACEMFPQFYEGSQTGDDIGAILLTHEGADAIDGYLSKVQGGQVKTLADLIKWQEEHPVSRTLISLTSYTTLTLVSRRSRLSLRTYRTSQMFRTRSSWH
jgi:hypothetical protein